MKELALTVLPWIITLVAWAVLGVILTLVAASSEKGREFNYHGEIAIPAKGKKNVLSDSWPFGGSRLGNAVTIFLAGPAIWAFVFLLNALRKRPEDD